MLKGFLPPAEAVRTEEFVNFFDYAYKAPDRDTFKVYVECAPSKFGRGLQMMKIGVKGRRLGREEQRRAVLTFLVDTSGSMELPDRLPLAKKSLRMLVERLNPQDLVAIVKYDSHARLVLEHTPASQKQKILDVLDNLQANGSTNLEEGMDRAYQVAARSFVSKGENRVLLMSDGVANLGGMGAAEILKKVEEYRKQGIFCSVFGLGIGTYNDEMLEALANKGDGTYKFVDSEEEAKAVFVNDLSASLNTIAKDVKIQVEFNPKCVARYRQLGYENRQLKKEDFRNDKIDAGEVGSGQSVTALYEMELGSNRGTEAHRHREADRIATVRVRYQRVDNGKVEEIERPVTADDIIPQFDQADVRFRLAASVAEFAEILRGSPFAEGSEFQDVARILGPVALELNLDSRVQELLRMVNSANGLSRGQ
jgi:Ca-activated chloride channel family protein